jgi:hypothetical protein
MRLSFDPFSDRTARDIRNSLSTALIADLESGTQTQVPQVAGRWLSGDLPSACRQFIQDRKALYQEAFRQIAAQGLIEKWQKAIVLWNKGLLFEMHELLEALWKTAEEPQRTALKGLIQAAGAYVHIERGNLKAAINLARRARRNLLAARQALGFIGNLQNLLDTLENPQWPPPALQPEKGIQADTDRHDEDGPWPSLE